MTGKKLYYLIAVIVSVPIAYFGWKLMSRNAYESAAYNVLESEGPFEQREYPDLMLVTTAMESQSSSDGGSFGRLFRYISGNNDDGRKVAMTTPVFMEPQNQQTDGQMGFVLPQQMAAANIPQPKSETVQIQQRAGGKFAVRRFSGRLDEAAIADNEEKLRQWIDSKNWSGNEGIEFAGYDPPWTPGPFRRNEVLIRLK